MKRKLLLISMILPSLVSCGNTQESEETISSNNEVSQSEKIVSESSVKENSSVQNSSSSTQESSNSISSSSEQTEITGNVIYCSPSAKSTTATGTREDPMRVVFAILNSKPGTTIVLMDGTYKTSAKVETGNDAEKYPATSLAEGKKLIAEHDGMVKFDFSSMSWNSSNRGIQINNSFWTVKGIEVFGAGDNGIYVGGSYNTIENCVTHDNGDTGLQIGRANSTQDSIEKWPSYNLIKNCTSYDNHDPRGEDSDGFACKLTTGVGNVFDGCIAYNNVDDGWDLYTKGDTGPIGPVTLINCIAFNNGVTTGQNTKGVPYGTSNSDGNGFKLGGETIAVSHTVKNCIAFNNLACGFTDNSNPGIINIENCTSYNNGVRDSDANNIDMARNVDTSINYYKGILSYCDKNVDFRTGEVKNFNTKDEYKGTAVNCLFNRGRTFLRFKDAEECNYTKTSLRGEIYDNSTPVFVSSTIPNHLSNIHELFRDENGNIKLNDFLKVNEDFIKAAYGESVSLGANLA